MAIIIENILNIFKIIVSSTKNLAIKLFIFTFAPKL